MWMDYTTLTRLYYVDWVILRWLCYTKLNGDADVVVPLEERDLVQGHWPLAHRVSVLMLHVICNAIPFSTPRSAGEYSRCEAHHRCEAPRERAPCARKITGRFLAALILPFNWLKIMSSELRASKIGENRLFPSRPGKLIFAQKLARFDWFRLVTCSDPLAVQAIIIFDTNVWLLKLNSFCRE